MQAGLPPLIDTIRFLSKTQWGFDPEKSGKALAFWLSNEKLLLSENIGRHSRHRDAGRVAATLVSYGYADQGFGTLEDATQKWTVDKLRVWNGH
jgi:hypothetical protein